VPEVLEGRSAAPRAGVRRAIGRREEERRASASSQAARALLGRSRILTALRREGGAAEHAQPLSLVAEWATGDPGHVSSCARWRAPDCRRG
jgi:predicted ATPase